MGVTGLLVALVSLLANCLRGTAVTLMGRHAFDAAVTVTVVELSEQQPEGRVQRRFGDVGAE